MASCRHCVASCTPAAFGRCVSTMGAPNPELQPLERLIVPRAVDGDDRHSGLQGQQRRALLEGQERFPSG